MTALLSLRQFSVVRGEPLIDSFELTVAAGECVELRGANGTGKSTLLRCIAGVSSDYAGDIDAQPSAYLAHADGLSGLLTARENLLWYARIAGRDLSDDAVVDQLRPLGVEHLARRLCQSLSAGQRRRVALARLALLERPLWLLDEPLTALDPDGAARVRETIQNHCDAGGGALVATHEDLGLPARQVWLDR